MALYRYWEF